MLIPSGSQLLKLVLEGAILLVMANNSIDISIVSLPINDVLFE